MTSVARRLQPSDQPQVDEDESLRRLTLATARSAGKCIIGRRNFRWTILHELPAEPSLDTEVSARHIVVERGGHAHDRVVLNPELERRKQEMPPSSARGLLDTRSIARSMAARSWSVAVALV